MCTLFSIGHGQKPLEEFLEELRIHKIQYLVDVRSVPYSKWSPQYNREQLRRYLNLNNIKYGYLGNQIGGRPESDDCFDKEGYISYRLMAGKKNFKLGLSRLIEANRDGFRVAVMCSESNPWECHRSKLIGRELYAYDPSINMLHIIDTAKSMTETEIIHMLDKSWTDPSLPTDPTNKGTLFFEEFDTVAPASGLPYFRSIKAYRSPNNSDQSYL